MLCIYRDLGIAGGDDESALLALLGKPLAPEALASIVDWATSGHPSRALLDALSQRHDLTAFQIERLVAFCDTWGMWERLAHRHPGHELALALHAPRDITARFAETIVRNNCGFAGERPKRR